MFCQITDGSSDNNLILKMALRKINMNNIMRCYAKQIMLSSTLLMITELLQCTISTPQQMADDREPLLL